MSSWDTILNGLTWLGDYFGLASRQTRTSRGAVLGALTRFHGLVNQVCGGFTLTPDVSAAFFSEIDTAYQGAAIKLNEESQWVGKPWLKDAERLMALGRRAVVSYQFAFSHQGPISARAMEEARKDCQEFKGLFEKMRGVKMKPGKGGRG